MRIYSLLDRKMREYGALVLGTNDETVVRALRESVAQNGNSTMGKYPEDYDLMCVGEFDPIGGEVVGRSPVLVVNVAELVEGRL